MVRLLTLNEDSDHWLTSAGSTHERRQGTRLDIPINVMKQSASTPWDGNVVVDFLPRERLAAKFGGYAGDQKGESDVTLCVTYSLIYAPVLVHHVTAFLLTVTPACAPFLSLRKHNIAFLDVGILVRKDCTRRTTVEMGKVLDQDNLGDLEDDKKRDEDKKVTAPEVGDVKSKSGPQVVAAGDGDLSWLRSKERAHLACT